MEGAAPGQLETLQNVGAAIMPAALGQSHSHGHMTQGGAGAIEGHKLSFSEEKIPTPLSGPSLNPSLWVGSTHTSGQLWARKSEDVHPVTSSPPSLAYGLSSCSSEKPLSLCPESCSPVFLLHGRGLPACLPGCPCAPAPLLSLCACVSSVSTHICSGS